MMKIATAAASLVLLAVPAVQAQDFAYQFDGFTVVFNGTRVWETVAPDVDTVLYKDVIYNAEGSLFGHGGVLVSGGKVSFSTSTSPQLSAANGEGPVAFHSSFTYTVQAKPGWQLQTSGLSGGQSGTYHESGGGSTSISGSESFSSVGGSWPDRYNNASKDIPSDSSGSWTQSVMQIASGNHFTPTFTKLDDGYAVRYSIGTLEQPLTSVTGNVELNLIAGSQSFSDQASISGGAGWFDLRVTAIKTVSPVPEPETYAMMLASFGLIGFMQRRRAKKQSAAA